MERGKGEAGPGSRARRPIWPCPHLVRRPAPAAARQRGQQAGAGARHVEGGGREGGEALVCASATDARSHTAPAAVTRGAGRRRTHARQPISLLHHQAGR